MPFLFNEIKIWHAKNNVVVQYSKIKRRKRCGLMYASIIKPLKKLLLRRKWLTICFDARIRYHHILKNIGKQHYPFYLDVGAGPGYLAEELRRRNLKIIVSDINFQQMREVKIFIKN